jgi:NADPH:quinone reductase-like Zn-dependent oxidoreductase
MEPMRAWRYHQFGEPSQVLKVELIPAKISSPDDVLIEVKAFSLNPVDYKVMRGDVKANIKLPYTPCVDISGIISEIGSNVKNLHLGSRVFAKLNMNAGGGLAEYALAKADFTFKLYDLPFEEASTLGIAALTPYQALQKAGIKEGSKVLIIGGSAGTGIFAIQFAKKWGAQVTATTRTENIDLLKKLGPDRVIDYTKEDWSQTLKGEKFDIIFDNVGGQYSKARGLGTPETKFVAIADFPPAEPIPNAPQYIHHMMQDDPKDYQTIVNWAEEKSIKPVIDKVYPFSLAVNAFEHVMSRKATGKVVLNLHHI